MDSPTATPASLAVTRTPPGGHGDQYQITLGLDGERLASLAPGETVRREIAPGRHQLRATNTLMRKTVEFDVRPGEQVRFTTRNRSGLGSTLFASLGAGLLYVALDRDAEDAAITSAP